MSDAAQRAVRCALEMQKGMRGVNEYNPQYPLLHPPLIPAPDFFSGYASLKIYQDLEIENIFWRG